MTAAGPTPGSVWLARAVAGCVILILIGVTILRVTGFEPDTPQPKGSVVAHSELRFEDGPDGSIEIYRHPSGVILKTLSAGEGGFLRGVMRSLARDRRSRDIDMTVPFVLERYADGALILTDPAIGQELNLAAFGPTNAAAFAALLEAATGGQ